MEILYVEDDEYYQFLVTKMLGKEGHKVRIASTMKEYEKIMNEEKYKPQIVLMDIILPDENGKLVPNGGIQLAKKEFHKEIPLIFITVWSFPEYIEEIKEITKNSPYPAYISKPLEIEEFINIFKKISGGEHVPDGSTN